MIRRPFFHRLFTFLQAGSGLLPPEKTPDFFFTPDLLKTVVNHLKQQPEKYAYAVFPPQTAPSAIRIRKMFAA